jgi:hypothetical protein
LNNAIEDEWFIEVHHSVKLVMRRVFLRKIILSLLSTVALLGIVGCDNEGI